MYKLFLIDYSMPEIDGLELVKILRKMIDESTLETQPVYCCCTAYQSKEHQDAAIDAGFNYFLNKPTDKDELHDIIKGLM